MEHISSACKDSKKTVYNKQNPLFFLNSGFRLIIYVLNIQKLLITG